MAAEWIPMRLDLDEDPAVVGVAAALEVPETQVIGWLWKLWSLVSRQTANGVLPHYTAQTIDRVVGRHGFASALEQVGWLHRRSDSLEIPNFGHWLSESAKKRCMGTVRKRGQRAAGKACPETVPKEVGQKWDSSSVISSPSSDGLGVRGEGEGDFALTPAGLAQEWCFLLARRKLGTPGDFEPDVADQFAELVRLGYAAGALLAAVRDPRRDRTEPFWEFRDRVKKSPPAPPGESEADRKARIAKERADFQRQLDEVRREGNGCPRPTTS
jgi:hypothetical protein